LFLIDDQIKVIADRNVDEKPQDTQHQQMPLLLGRVLPGKLLC